MSRFKFFDSENGTDQGIEKVELEVAREQPMGNSADGKDILSARYRSEQQIITRHNGDIVSNGVLKHEYLLSIDLVNLLAQVTITDAYGSYEPEMLNDLTQLSLLVDSVRHEQKFALDKKGRAIDLLNKSDMISNWMTLRTMQLKDGKFLTTFTSDEQAEIIKEVNSYCDVIFSDNYPMLEELSKNLFHYTVFDKYLMTDQLEGKDDRTSEFYSNMFNIPLKIEFTYENIIDENDVMKFEKNSNLLYADFKLITDIYKEKYQPVLHYGFTDYIYKINSRIEIDKKQNLIKQANVTITEAVKNNVENTIHYTLKQVEL